MKTGASPSYVLIFDEECEICRRSIDWIQRSAPPGLIETLPYQDASVPHRFSDIPPRVFEQAIQLIGPDMKRMEGARAVEEILTMIPGARRTAPFFRLPGMRWLAERIYQVIARNRRRFGCGDHCSRPSNEPQVRPALDLEAGHQRD